MKRPIRLTRIDAIEERLRTLEKAVLKLTLQLKYLHEDLDRIKESELNFVDTIINAPGTFEHENKRRDK